MSVFEWVTWLGALAALIAIVSAGYQFIRWFKNRFKAKPFGKTVSANFTYRDVAAGVDKLVEFSYRFNPEEIVGINRGGAIVGGLIGKHLGIVPRIIEVDPLLPWEPKDGAKPINFARRSEDNAIPFTGNSPGNQPNSHRPPQKNKKEK